MNRSSFCRSSGPQVLTIWPVNRFFPDALDNSTQDMAFLGYRLATLSALPSSVTVSRVRLADAGFYYKGHEDEVHCYSCKGRYSRWKSDDNPLEVHRRISPACLHLSEMDRELYFASRSSIGHENLSGAGSGIFSDVYLPSGNSHDQSLEDAQRSSRQPRADRNPTTHSNSSGGSTSDGRPDTGTVRPMFPRPKLDLGGAVYPMYQDMASRRRSYPTWNERAAPPLDQMILCGMYFTGTGDCVRCFYCGVGLKSWEVTDNVWKEHIRWRPNCGYLLAVKGESYIRQVLEQIRQEVSSGEGHRSPIRSSQSDAIFRENHLSIDNHQIPEQLLPEITELHQNPTTQYATITSPTTQAASIISPTSRAASVTSVSTTAVSSTRQLQSLAASCTESSTSSTASSTASSTVSNTSLLQTTESALSLLLTSGPMILGSSYTAAMSGVTTPSREIPLFENTTQVDTIDGRITDIARSSITLNTSASGDGERVSLLRENSGLPHRLECKMCHCSVINTIFLPCGHLVTCETCANSVTNCLICHNEVQGTARVHMD